MTGWPECGSGAECFALGERFRQGQSVPIDLARARRLFDKACRRGFFEGCVQAGWIYQRGEGSDRDLGKAASYFDRACASHHADGCLFLARAYRSGLGVPKSDSKATELMAAATDLHRQSCESGSREACHQLFMIYATGDGVARDPVRSAGFAERACLLDDETTCWPAAMSHLKGGGGDRDLPRATRLLEHGCKGSATRLACCALATAYSSGDSPVADASAAPSLLQRACSLGEAQACIAVYAASASSPAVRDALKLFAGSCANPYPPEGCPRTCELDDVRNKARREAAVAALTAACERDEAQACLVLGLAYDQWIGGLDGGSKKAVDLLEKSCAANLPTGCYVLGYLVAFGAGPIEQNLRRSQQLYRKACETGLDAACASLGLDRRSDNRPQG